MKLNPALKDFWQTKRQIKVIYGGRMSSKTEDTAGILTYLASKYKIRVACLRRFQKNIEQSVYKTLKRKITEDEYFKPLFNINTATIKSTCGSEFIFMGTQLNLEEIKGLDDIDITWIEEAEKLTEVQWNLIRPTILRKEGSFVILVFNPYLDTDFVYKEFVTKQRDNTLTRKINYTQNPFLSSSAKDLILSDEKNLDEDEFNNIYLGMPRAGSEDALIKRAWLYECVDAHKKLGIEPTGSDNIGYDIADTGVDKNALAHSFGILLRHIEQWQGKEDALDKSHTKVYNYARDVKGSIINYDSIGVGAGAGSKFRELNEGQTTRVKYYKFNAGAGVDNPDKKYGNTEIKNKDMFSNLKALAWWDVADRVKMTYNAVTKGTEYDEDEVISLSSSLKELDALIVELSTPLKDTDKTGKVRVESKEDLKKRGIPSPNLADAFIMATHRPKKTNGFFTSGK
jgi:phage terminase large subunit